MKHKFAAFFLAVMLLCTLLTSCVPSDSPNPGGNPSSTPSGDNNSGSEPDDSNGGTNSAKLPPSVSMACAVQLGSQENTYVTNYKFTITNPNTEYSIKVRLSMTATNGSGDKKSDYTFSPLIAPGDTVCFMYTKSFTGFRPTNSTLKTSTDYSIPDQVVRTSDLIAPKPTETKNIKVDYNTFSGVVSNTSKYPTKVKVSLFLKKNGQFVSADAPTLLLSIPANGTASYNILHYKDAAYDDYEVTATPWN